MAGQGRNSRLVCGPAVRKLGEKGFRFPHGSRRAAEEDPNHPFVGRAGRLAQSGGPPGVHSGHDRKPIGSRPTAPSGTLSPRGIVGKVWNFASQAGALTGHVE